MEVKRDLLVEITGRRRGATCSLLPPQLSQGVDSRIIVVLANMAYVSCLNVFQFWWGK